MAYTALWGTGWYGAAGKIGVGNGFIGAHVVRFGWIGSYLNSNSWKLDPIRGSRRASCRTVFHRFLEVDATKNFCIPTLYPSARKMGTFRSTSDQVLVPNLICNL